MAQQGHLHKCPHLVGVSLPRQPQLTPSESCWDSQKKAETLATSSSEPSAQATATPVMETPVMETPATHSDTPDPMETGRAGDSWSWDEQVEAGIDEEFGKDRPTSITSPNPGGGKKDPRFPSPSKTVRGGWPPFYSSTNMQEGSLQPATMWLPKGSFISIWRCCCVRLVTWEIRLSA